MKYLRVSECTSVTVLVLLCSSAIAQVTGGTFTGSVMDSSNAAMRDAKVTAKNVASGVEAEVRSNSEGVYRMPPLLPGIYLLTAQKKDFRQMVFGPVALEVNRTVTVSFTLPVGSTSESVTVQASAVQSLETATSELAQVVGSQAVSQFPLNGRDWKQLIVLLASANTGSPAEGLAGSNFVLQGQRSQGNAFLIDGSPATEGGLNIIFGAIPLDGIGEFSIRQSGYSAQWGNTAGGVVNVQTKSGTNRYHGSAFEFLRNDSLDAANFFSNATGGQPNIYHYNQFGVAAGGPLQRNRLFFFADYQGTRIRQGQPGITTVPSAAERTGDFSKSLDPAGKAIAIYDPFSTSKTPFPANVIPFANIDSAARNLMALVPAPNLFDASGQPQRFNNYVSIPNADTRGDAFDTRLDYAQNARSHWFVRNSYQTVDLKLASIFGPPLSGSATGLNPFRGTRDWTIQNAGIGQTLVKGPDLINEFRGGLQRTLINLQGENYGKTTASQVGIPGVNLDHDTSGLPYLQIQGLFDMGDSLATPTRESDTNWLFADSLTWIRGKHSITLGAEYARDRNNNFSVIYPRGFYVFEPTMTGSLADVLAGRNTGSALASFEVGAPTAVIRDRLAGTFGLRSGRFGAYFEDNLKASTRLTLNLGLRYDVLPPYSEVRNRIADFDLGTREMQIAGQGVPRGLRYTRFKDWSPRIGLAYALTRDEKTVFRTAYGIGRMNLLNNPSGTLSMAMNPPFYSAQNITQNPFAIPAIFLSANVPPIPAPQPTSPTGNVSHVDTDSPNSYSQTWHAGIQRAITSSLVSEVSYIGSSGVHLVWPVNINAAPPGTGDRTLRRPFGTQFGSIIAYEAAGHSTYQGLQAKLENRFRSGLYLLASYTFSKGIDGQSTGVESTTADNQSRLPQNPRNLKAERGLASFDHHHRFTWSSVWEIPFGHSRRYGSRVSRPIEAVFGGWQLAAVYTAQSGAPFSAVMACSDVNGDGNCRPNRLKDGNLQGGDRTPSRWFDTGAFAKPPSPAYGNAGRDILTGPRLFTMDSSLSKTIPIAETRRLQFRWELFNLFNHTNLDQPVNSIDSPAFGSITSAENPRLMQFGLRFEF